MRHDELKDIDIVIAAINREPFFVATADMDDPERIINVDAMGAPGINHEAVADLVTMNRFFPSSGLEWIDSDEPNSCCRFRLTGSDVTIPMSPVRTAKS